MKKYFLDKNYTKFTVRVFLALSIVLGIMASFIADQLTPYPDHPVPTFLAVLAVWATYFVIKWILKALPTDRD